MNDLSLGILERKTKDIQTSDHGIRSVRAKNDQPSSNACKIPLLSYDVEVKSCARYSVARGHSSIEAMSSY